MARQRLADAPVVRSHPGRRGWLRTVACAALLCLGLNSPALAAPAHPCPLPVSWPAWDAYLTHFVQADGRVLDASTPKQHSSSESQSYGMFFALVANDPVMFEKIWTWTVNNLAQGDIATHLPAWIWGLTEDGDWQVLDDNAASDADLWIIYALAEAARAWQRDDYLYQAKQLLAQVEAREVDTLPGLGKMLLPGPEGFARPDGTWQLNPSYMPMPVLRQLATLSPNGPWQEIASNTARMFEAITPHGFAADWVGYQVDAAGQGQFVVDPVKGQTGSYDAIRVYLWAGLTHPADPLFRPILASLHGMRDVVAAQQLPPEQVAVVSAALTNTGPFGFSAALVPYLDMLGETAMAKTQSQRAATLWRNSIDAAVDADATQPPYYDNMLHLFSTGWQEGHYRFNADGSLNLKWEQGCPHANTPSH